MLGVKCKQCNNKFMSVLIIAGDGRCVFCYHKTDKFYYNGDLLSRQKVIADNFEIGKFHEG